MNRLLMCIPKDPEQDTCWFLLTSYNTMGIQAHTIPQYRHSFFWTKCCLWNRVMKCSSVMQLDWIFKNYLRKTSSNGWLEPSMNTKVWSIKMCSCQSSVKELRGSATVEKKMVSAISLITTTIGQRQPLWSFVSCSETLSDVFTLVEGLVRTYTEEMHRYHSNRCPGCNTCIYVCLCVRLFLCVCGGRGRDLVGWRGARSIASTCMHLCTGTHTSPPTWYTDRLLHMQHF